MKGWIRLSSIHVPSVKRCPDVRAWRVLSSYTLAMTPLSQQAPQKTAEGSVPQPDLSQRPSGETEDVRHDSDREGYTLDPCQPAKETSDLPKQALAGHYDPFGGNFGAAKCFDSDMLNVEAHRAYSTRRRFTVACRTIAVG